MRVGIPCMKCSLHPSQQVNKKTGKASKTCGIGSAWREMNDERLGRDPTIDKSMTEKNIWMVGNSNDDIENKLEEKDLLEQAKSKLPNYMCPNEIHCIERMPYNANGKIDRKELKNRI